MKTTIASDMITPRLQLGTLRQAQTALVIGIVQTIPFALIAMFATLSPEPGPFDRTVDYWYTGIGIPLAAAVLLLLPALHALQGVQGRKTRLWGLVIAFVSLAVMIVLLADCLIESRSTSWGPTYILATLFSFIGVAVFAAGSWRGRLLPHWLLMCWPIAYLVGGLAAQGPTPILLAAAYIAIGVVLMRHFNGAPADPVQVRLGAEGC